MVLYAKCKKRLQRYRQHHPPSATLIPRSINYETKANGYQDDQSHQHIADKGGHIVTTGKKQLEYFFTIRIFPGNGLQLTFICKDNDTNT